MSARCAMAAGAVQYSLVAVDISGSPSSLPEKPLGAVKRPVFDLYLCCMWFFGKD